MGWNIDVLENTCIWFDPCIVRNTLKLEAKLLVSFLYPRMYVKTKDMKASEKALLGSLKHYVIH